MLLLLSTNLLCAYWQNVFATLKRGSDREGQRERENVEIQLSNSKDITGFTLECARQTCYRQQQPGKNVGLIYYGLNKLLRLLMQICLSVCHTHTGKSADKLVAKKCCTTLIYGQQQQHRNVGRCAGLLDNAAKCATYFSITRCNRNVQRITYNVQQPAGSWQQAQHNGPRCPG